MFTTKELETPVSMMVSPESEDHHEISRLLAAAVVNPGFCHKLLNDPQLAIDNGYQGESFQLADAERHLVTSIHANSLAEFARQIAQAFGFGLPKQSYSFAPATNSFSF